ncbi:MAG: acyltransferase [Treponema sp.]|jgi:1-acyl-sn-glycerol-3-phosphate acyltransferase|nr:acyltransferase [Treponema sp.]
MYKPYIKPVSQASPDVKTREPRVSRLVYFVCWLLGRLYLYVILGITRIVLRRGEHFFKAYQRALEGKSRCIVAFRHPNGGEAQLLMYFILFKLRALARRAKIKFCRRPYVSFVYGYEVARWGGALARWIMPNLNAMPVHHAKMDATGMNRIFSAIENGPYPLAIAPEGQVSYTTESVPRLEQGAVRIGFQAAERLAQSGRDIPVEIIPISIHFRYGKMGEWSLKRLLKKIEKYTGLHPQNGGLGLAERFTRARDYILAQNEKRYGLAAEGGFNERVDALIEAALTRAEQILGNGKRGNEMVERIYHIRQVCWDRMIIPGNHTLDHLTPLERSSADLLAGEAWYASRHMELVDFVWYFRVPVPRENEPLYVKLEYAQNLWDFANRTMGGAYVNRVLNVHPKRLLIQAAPVINLSERLNDYKKNKKEAIAGAMADMKTAFLNCISEAAEYQI